MAGLNWRPVTELPDTDLAFETFNNMFQDLFNIYLPEKTRKIKKNRDALNEFMTPGLLKSRKRKLYLARSARNGDAIAKQSYKTYRNIYKKLVRLSKKLFFEQKIHNSKHNKKALYNILYEATGINSNKSEDIEKIEVDSKLIEDSALLHILIHFSPI